MTRQQYRTELGILKDILDVIMDRGQNGAIVSAICRKANLSHYAAIDKCEKLGSAGLVECMNNDRHRIYLMTEKGIEFFREFQRFEQLTNSKNLRF